MAQAKGRIGLIGGSGLGAALAAQTKGKEHFADTPFGKPSGPIVTTELDGVPIAFISRHGPGHLLNPSAIPYRANIYALKQLGVTHIIASAATGALVEDIAPRDLVICDQVIDRTYKRDKTFFDAGLVAHVDFAYPFCEQLRAHLLSTAKKLFTGGASDRPTVHRAGTYVCMEGPQFSTRAESLLHRQMGGHLIGMTCMPEAKLAREAEMCYALVALPTDYDCWREHNGDVDKHSLMAEIIANLNAATENAITLIRSAVATAGELLAKSCEHHKALELAIWSDKSRVAPEVRKKLDLLVGKYF
ncbi:MAG: S-methyl-5'-thioadenosine phosphorylase [Sedimentisphaerales bacterium]|nr:S-methyl-5'-thioadenosine phosphorylase [Sedimentisphaerales bacterium]